MTEITFHWNSSGNDVKIAGSFNNWIPTQMNKSDDEWIYKYIINDDKVIFKFIIDGEWQINNTLETITDENQNVNNVVLINEEYLIDEINYIHPYGIEENQYSFDFLKKLYKLFIDDIIDFEDNDCDYLIEIGNYYEFKEDNNNMIKYWLLANEKGTINIQIMHSLANYYNKEKQYIVNEIIVYLLILSNPFSLILY